MLCILRHKEAHIHLKNLYSPNYFLFLKLTSCACNENVERKWAIHKVLIYNSW